MDQEIEEWLESAAVSTGLPIERLPTDRAAEIEHRARQCFVSDNPRAWWMSLSGSCEHFDAKERKLKEVLPDGATKCWLIAETGSTSGLPVYSLDVRNVSAVLDECPYFEYYIVAEDFSWLVAESDHNVLFVCRPCNPERVVQSGPSTAG
jgi:hypothetical protein